MRISLAFLNFLALHFLRRSVIQKFGSSAGRCFIWICCSQFHFMFYLGRPLPNIFALAIITYAFSCYLDGVLFYIFLLLIQNYKRFIYLLTMCCVIIRCDTLVLFAPFLLHILINQYLSLLQIILCGITAGLFSLILSVTFFFLHSCIVLY